jgi:hypothetical protein
VNQALSNIPWRVYTSAFAGVGNPLDISRSVIKDFLDCINMSKNIDKTIKNAPAYRRYLGRFIFILKIK